MILYTSIYMIYPERIFVGSLQRNRRNQSMSMKEMMTSYISEQAIRLAHLQPGKL